MCGIVGYVGKHQATQILMDGLKRLEYRGYDSSGIVVMSGKSLQLVKKIGRVENLAKEVSSRKIRGCHGIGHTRWATHGGVTDVNAHPHLSNDGKFAIIHNGVIENYLQIKRFLETKGFRFLSETDTEVLINLISYHYDKEQPGTEENRFLVSVRKSLLHVEGTYGIAVICTDFPNEIVGARKGSPLCLGIGKDEYILSSDVASFASRTQNVVFLNDYEIVHVTETNFSVTNTNADGVETVVHKIDWDLGSAELGDFSHFMEKEIFEQPNALENAMRGRFSEDGSTAHFGGLRMTPQELRQIDRIVLCACGSAWHACLVAETLIEKFARIPVEVEYASEFRYGNAPLDKNTLVFVISQSGETQDTLAALRESKRKGFKTLAICNVVGSTIAREADGGIYQHSGPEIGVASTKAFTSQICIAAMLALYLGRMRDLSYDKGVRFVEALKQLPSQIKDVINQHEKIKSIAHKYINVHNFLFLGRQSLFPIALEGALKLKEVSYIHAEGYPSAEMKHGPIAMINPEFPSFFLATQKTLFQKVVSNMQEIHARKGPVIALISEGLEVPPGIADDIINIPSVHEAVQPILATVVLQLFAYYIALERGCDVDKPRNLAKSVTVE